MEEIQEVINTSAEWFMNIPWTEGEAVMLAGILLGLGVMAMFHIMARTANKRTILARVVSLGEQMKAMSKRERAAYVRSRLAAAIFEAVDKAANEDDLSAEDVNKFYRSFARSYGMWDLASHRFCKHPNPDDLKQAIKDRLGERLHELRVQAIAKEIAKSPIVTKAVEPPPIPQVETKKVNLIMAGLRNGKTQHA